MGPLPARVRNGPRYSLEVGGEDLLGRWGGEDLLVEEHEEVERKKLGGAGALLYLRSGLCCATIHPVCCAPQQLLDYHDLGCHDHDLGFRILCGLITHPNFFR